MLKQFFFFNKFGLDLVAWKRKSYSNWILSLDKKVAYLSGRRPVGCTKNRLEVGGMAPFVAMNMKLTKIAPSVGTFDLRV